MKQLPLVTIIGDKTGGGSGLPFTSEIPNGWSIRFSASPMFDPEMNQLEFGIDPDIKVDISTEDYARGIDTRSMHFFEKIGIKFADSKNIHTFALESRRNPD